MTKEIYIAYISNKAGNHILGRVFSEDIDKYKHRREINLMKTTIDKVEEVEKGFLPIEIKETNRPQVVVKKKTTNYNYEAVPKRMHKRIKKAYEAKEYDNLYNWIEKYNITNSCGTCDRNGRVMNIWKYFFEVYL